MSSPRAAQQRPMSAGVQCCRGPTIPLVPDQCGVSCPDVCLQLKLITLLGVVCASGVLQISVHICVDICKSICGPAVVLVTIVVLMRWC